MINYSKIKNPMPELDPEVRKKSFEESATGYTEEMAVREAMRCLKCRKKPCMMKGCPVHNRIPDFIGKVAEGDFEAAYSILRETTTLPAVCGRVCPQSKQCEGSCVRGVKGEPVSIGALERFVSDWHRRNYPEEERTIPKPNGYKVAVVGAGPAGLTCAKDLAEKGYEVTVFEKNKKAGGALVTGIPAFRLPNEVVDREVQLLEKLGVTIHLETEIGKKHTVEDLFVKDGFHAVFLANGAGIPSVMGIPGEDLEGVYLAGDYLKKINLDRVYDPKMADPLLHAKSIAIIGGGNVAMDACRSAARSGAKKVYVIYRRSREEMPAYGVEVDEAIAEGVEFMYLTNPVKVIGDKKGHITGLECVKMELGEPDESGRRRPQPIEGSNFTIDVDRCVMAIGTTFDKSFTDTLKKVKVSDRGAILAKDDSTETSHLGVFAGGDNVTGPATVIKAMGAGKKAASEIDYYLQNGPGLR